MIFSLRKNFLESDDFVFKKYKSKIYDNHPQSDLTYNMVCVRNIITLMEESTELKHFFGVSNDDSGFVRLSEIANELVEKNYGDHELIQSDIDNHDFDYLLQDIFDIIDENRSNSELLRILSSFNAKKTKPHCCHCEDSGYKAFGITHLPKGCTPDPMWVDSLLDDFTTEGDEVKLAIHGSTDWWMLNDTGFGYMPRFSEMKSEEKRRIIEVHIFQHEEFDCIVKALAEKELASVWEKILKS